MPAEGSSRSVLAVRRTGRPGPRSNYELSTCDYTRDNGRAVLFAQVSDTTVPKSAPASSAEPVEVSSEDLEALEEGVAVADQ